MRRWRLLPLLGGALCLLFGLMTGAWRLGWALPVGDWAVFHGPLLVCGFFGTVIALERAIAFGSPGGFLAPFATALGGGALILGAPSLGFLGLGAGSVAFLGLALLVAWRQREAFTALLALGALAWATGTLAWIVGGSDIARVAPLWAAFLLLTIAGERLELSRFLKPWRWRTPTLIPPVILVGVGAVLALVPSLPLDWGWRVFGLGALLLVGWSLINDVARRTILQPGLPRYVAVCLLLGYGWLGIAGGFALVSGTIFSDIVLHGLFLGFAFSMVFGHAPVILPAVLGVRLPFRRLFYLPPILLVLSLGTRMMGSIPNFDFLRHWGGALNAATILIFLALVLYTIKIR